MAAFTNLMKKMGLYDGGSGDSPEAKKKKMAEAQERLKEKANKNKATGGKLTRFSREAEKLK